MNVDKCEKITYNENGDEKMKNKKLIGFIVGISAIVLIVGSIFFYQWGTGAVSSQDEEVIVQVKPGANASTILNTLNESGLVNNTLCGKIFLKLNTYDHIQANTYIFNKNMSLSKMYSIMSNPEEQYILKSKLTIKEGNTIPQVAEAFAKILKVPSKEVIKQWEDEDYLNSLIKEYWFIEDVILDDQLMYPLEGYLYPETYFVTDEKPTLESMTKLALDMMDKKLTPYKEDIQKMGWSVHEFLSFASVVERESGTDETDRPTIAGVFLNRLKKGMKLQSDITVNYAWQRTGVDVSIKHTQIDSPYNTYKYVGLPVGPISTIPEETMDNCIHYTKSDYLYFVAIKDKDNPSQSVVIYTKSYDEHLKEVKKAKDAGLWLQ